MKSSRSLSQMALVRPHGSSKTNLRSGRPKADLQIHVKDGERPGRFAFLSAINRRGHLDQRGECAGSRRSAPDSTHGRRKATKNSRIGASYFRSHYASDRKRRSHAATGKEKRREEMANLLSITAITTMARALRHPETRLDSTCGDWPVRWQPAPIG